MWGRNFATRALSKSCAAILALPMTAVGVGLVGGGVGVVSGCAAACVAAMIPSTVIVGSYRMTQTISYRLKRKHEYKVLVMLPWRNNVTWLKDTLTSESESVSQSASTQLDGDEESRHKSETGKSFLGYPGRYHRSGIFVAKSVIRTSNTDEIQSWKKWFKNGPIAISNQNCSVVMYFIPRCTAVENIEAMLPHHDSYPKAAYPSSTWEPRDAHNDQSNLEYYVVRQLNDHSSAGLKHPQGTTRVNINANADEVIEKKSKSKGVTASVAIGCLDDTSHYDTPVDPQVVMFKPNTSSDISFTRCKLCTTPKYYTSEASFAMHMLEVHPDISHDSVDNTGVSRTAPSVAI